MENVKSESKRTKSNKIFVFIVLFGILALVIPKVIQGFNDGKTQNAKTATTLNTKKLPQLKVSPTDFCKIWNGLIDESLVGADANSFGEYLTSLRMDESCSSRTSNAIVAHQSSGSEYSIILLLEDEKIKEVVFRNDAVGSLESMNKTKMQITLALAIMFGSHDAKIYTEAIYNIFLCMATRNGPGGQLDKDVIAWCKKDGKWPFVEYDGSDMAVIKGSLPLVVRTVSGKQYFSFVFDV